jgi:hypothetical protein
MFHKPVGYFLIGLTLFLLVFGVLTSNTFGMPQVTMDWLSIVCLLVSQLFAWMAVIKGIRLNKKKEKGFALNLAAIIGSSVIILLFVYWLGLLLYLLYG